ncbi:hypothetical protein Cni_G19546 [Canna indica]|uniref:Uncharacterized protein n=1 Tax=Canna indica TaxID=4628 RepID=A0AAQ3KRU7_9LILI|nr:hypothetical protein Cni_G19546 [Canna indica]
MSERSRKRGNSSQFSAQAVSAATALIDKLGGIAVKDTSATGPPQVVPESPASCVLRLQSFGLDAHVNNHVINCLIKNPNARSFFVALDDEGAVAWFVYFSFYIIYVLVNYILKNSTAAVIDSDPLLITFHLFFRKAGEGISDGPE